MFMSSAAIAQSLQWTQEREDGYLARIGQYDPKTQALFPKMFSEIALALEQEGCVDVLGEIYMDLELSNHWKGQFFTPSNICLAMAKMLIGNPKGEIERKGFITVSDPCCGGGAMLIATANHCQEQGVDFQRDVLFVGQDIDLVVARMCYIQMSLLGMPGYVIIGNSLTADTENWEALFTPMYFLSGFPWRMQWEVANEGLV